MIWVAGQGASRPDRSLAMFSPDRVITLLAPVARMTLTSCCIPASGQSSALEVCGPVSTLVDSQPLSQHPQGSVVAASAVVMCGSLQGSKMTAGLSLNVVATDVQ